MNLSKLSIEEKTNYQKILLSYIKNFESTNHFLTFIEAIRKEDKNPVLATGREFHCFVGNITWTKAIFADKLEVLKNAQSTTLDQNHKRTLNAIKTLTPINFTMKIKDKKKKFEFKIFDVEEQEASNEKKVIKITPIFDVLFLSSIADIKRILKLEV
ncbi:MAG: Unknown protein [uncultured Campylobacterales bacterium]|uniref:Uncharacterized protein n=1 Tax=uncultured Campylobacterales bacterium TaxID=352960 RepID=A0A6S6TKZ8_9BACT|nr:MAG: Unknown protein [uncultured Campylobacterales bacterium]